MIRLMSFRKNVKDVTIAMLKKKIFENPSTSAMFGNGNKRFKTDDPQGGLLDLSVDNCEPSDVSKYFPNLQRSDNLSIDSKVIQLQLNLNNDLRALDIIKPPIEYVYNPLEYAFQPNEMYIRKYCTTQKKILFVGMNPGPFGMCQTGVPFGDPKWVRGWLKIEGEVAKPLRECPERKILGFSSEKKEVSGDRFWGLFSKLCESPEIFFRHSFVVNFCPLAFMRQNGTNLTPIEIEIKDRNALESVCDIWYLNLIQLLDPEIIVPIGRYIEGRTRNLLKKNSIGKKVIYMQHPSPRVKNHQIWPEKAELFLRENNLMSYFTK